MNAGLLNSPMVRGRRRSFDLRTPEGVELRFEIPSMGQRFLAFSLDLAIIFITQMLLSLVFLFVFQMAAFAFVQLLWFFLANLYFPICEFRWGATLGKRALGIRVIERAGGPLGLEGVLTRNFLRDIEFWIPLSLFTQNSLMAQSLPFWSAPLAFCLLIGFTFFPSFNRRHLRIGDYIGGTIVVATPKPRLISDLAQKAQNRRFSFTTEQLSVYGRLELQVLEDLLRRPSRDVGDVEARVTRKVLERIGWNELVPVGQNRAFLEAFYLAQREELERLLALGKGRERKAPAAGFAPRRP